MAGFVVYIPPTPEQLEESVKMLEAQIPDWFVKFPRRKICRVQGFNGKVLNIKRGDNIRAAVEASAGLNNLPGIKQ